MSIEYLQLSYNHLTDLQPDTFANLTALKHLALHNNQFTTLDPETLFINQPSQFTITVQGNRLNISANMAITRYNESEGQHPQMISAFNKREDAQNYTIET